MSTITVNVSKGDTPKSHDIEHDCSVEWSCTLTGGYQAGSWTTGARTETANFTITGPGGQIVHEYKSGTGSSNFSGSFDVEGSGDHGEYTFHVYRSGDNLDQWTATASASWPEEETGVEGVVSAETSEYAAAFSGVFIDPIIGEVLGAVDDYGVSFSGVFIDPIIGEVLGELGEYTASIAGQAIGLPAVGQFSAEVFWSGALVARGGVQGEARAEQTPGVAGFSGVLTSSFSVGDVGVTLDGYAAVVPGVLGVAGTLSGRPGGADLSVSGRLGTQGLLGAEHGQISSVLGRVGVAGGLLGASSNFAAFVGSAVFGAIRGGVKVLLDAFGSTFESQQGVSGKLCTNQTGVLVEIAGRVIVILDGGVAVVLEPASAGLKAKVGIHGGMLTERTSVGAGLLGNAGVSGAIFQGLAPKFARHAGFVGPFFPVRFQDAFMFQYPVKGGAPQLVSWTQSLLEFLDTKGDMKAFTGVYPGSLTLKFPVSGGVQKYIFWSGGLTRVK